MRWLLLLDRDGVINQDYGYVGDVSRFELVPGIVELVKRATTNGAIVVVVTNQSGISRGHYSLADFIAVSAHMREVFSANQAPISRVVFCPHLPSFSNDFLVSLPCNCRKPSPNMLLEAMRWSGIPGNRAAVIGDQDTDMEAGVKAGVRVRVLVRPEESNHAERATHQVAEVSELMSLDFPSLLAK